MKKRLFMQLYVLACAIRGWYSASDSPQNAAEAAFEAVEKRSKGA
jgi:hypothetical protein